MDDGVVVGDMGEKGSVSLDSTDVTGEEGCD